MADTDLRLGLFRRWYKICGTYVHQAAIGGGTTCPYEQLTPTSPNLSMKLQNYSIESETITLDYRIISIDKEDDIDSVV